MKITAIIGKRNDNKEMEFEDYVEQNILENYSLDTGQKCKETDTTKRNYLEIRKLQSFTSKMSVRMTWFFIIILSILLMLNFGALRNKLVEILAASTKDGLIN